MREMMKKLTILLSAIPSACMVSLLSSSVNYIHTEYAQFNEALVTMILTIPTITVMLGLISAPILAKKFPIKNSILIGLAIFTFCNVALVWCDNFYLMLLLRGLGGIGCGVVLPLQITIIATYPDKERTNLLGGTVTAGCLITVALVAISGIIAELNWRYVFFLYLINAVTIVLGIFFLPKDVTAQEKEATQEKSEEHFGDYKATLFLYLFLMAASYLCTNIMSAEIAPYLKNVQLGGAKESGLMMSMSLIGGTISGLCLTKYIELLKSHAMSGVFVGTTTAFALMWTAPSLFFVGIACFLIGFFGAMVGSIANYELSNALPLSLFTGASAGVNFVMFVLQFLAPTMFMGVLALIPSGSFRVVCMIYMIIQACFIVISSVLPKILLKQ